LKNVIYVYIYASWHYWYSKQSVILVDDEMDTDFANLT